jgi:hypothetical protein
VGNWGGQGRKTSFDTIKGQLAGEGWDTVKAHSHISAFGATIFIVEGNSSSKNMILVWVGRIDEGSTGVFHSNRQSRVMAPLSMSNIG